MVAEDKSSVERPLLRQVLRDDVLVVQLRCPECHGWADIDSEQLHGKAPTSHMGEGCNLLTLRNWFTESEWVEGRGPDDDVMILRGPDA